MTYEEDQTPFVDFISPSQGEDGTIVTIHGSKFSDIIMYNKVMIGKSPCELMFANESIITCRAGPQSAGNYAVTVLNIELGMAETKASVSFRYLLKIDSIKPSFGGVSGGNRVEIRGTGFLTFIKDEYEGFKLPWLMDGIGTPHEGPEGNMHFSPSFNDTIEDSFYNSEAFVPTIFEDDIPILTFENHVRELYYNSPSKVTVGNSSCIIVESNVTYMECILTTSIAGTFDTSVSVFDQTAVLMSSYTISEDNTATIIGISPSSGPVVSDSNIEIYGNNFMTGSGAAETKVIVGSEPCEIEFINNTLITCTIASPNIGPQLVLVSTNSGIAILESALADVENQTISSLFPTFTYQLEITNTSFYPCGSVYGGNEVSFSGAGFIEGEVYVTVGEMTADLVSTSYTEVIISTPSSSKNNYIHSSFDLVNPGEKKYKYSTALVTYFVYYNSCFK